MKSIKKDNTEVKNRFAKLLTTYRKKQDLTQKGLSVELGVSESAVKQWETGGNLPKPASLASICQKLDCSYDHLLTGMKEKDHDDHVICSLTGISEMAAYTLRSQQELSKKSKKEKKDYYKKYAAVVSAVATDKVLNAAIADYIFSKKISLSYVTTSNVQPLDLEIEHLLVNGKEIDEAFMDAARLQKIKDRLDHIRKEGDQDQEK